jgi:hypothetical protein
MSASFNGSDQHGGKIHPRNLLVAVAGLAITIATVVEVPATSAKSVTWQASNQDTAQVSYAKSKVWLKLSYATGGSCYSGNGSLSVALPDVSRATIYGDHSVYLSFSPPGNVDEVTIGTGTLSLLVSRA